jgi:hypothetical protein
MPEELKVALKEGDKVFYVPHLCHAHEKDARGVRPWAIGVTVTHTKVTKGKVHILESVHELEGLDLERYLEAIRKSPIPGEELKKISYLRPQRLLEAVIDEVNPDGTCDLKVRSNVPGVTLLYRGLSFDPDGQTPHSFTLNHPKEATQG